MVNKFKDAQFETNQPIEFEADQLKFKISNTSAGRWDVDVVNSSVVRQAHCDSSLFYATYTKV